MERKEVEEKRQDSIIAEERLIYYADFYDLGVIIKKNWQGIFQEVFGDSQRLALWLKELERFRDPDAHRRELLPHQKHYALGIAGEIGSRIVRHRSKMQTNEDVFPRIECVRDNYGNIWTAGQLVALHPKTILRPGDILQIIVTARDPEEMPLKYLFRLESGIKSEWQDSNEWEHQITDMQISASCEMHIAIMSPRSYHAHSICDDFVKIFYKVFPSIILKDA